MNFPLEKLPDTVFELIFEYTENDTDFCYDPETNEMNFYFPMAYTNLNSLAATKDFLDRKCLIHKNKCGKLIECECDKRVLVFSGNGGKMPLEFVRGHSKKIVVEWHSTQQMAQVGSEDEWLFDQCIHKGSRSVTPHFSGIAKFYEFGPITNIGALSSDFIAQLDFYHGLKGKSCCVNYKHDLLDKFLKFQDKDREADSEKLTRAQLTNKEKQDYEVEDCDGEPYPYMYEFHPYKIPNHDPVGFFVRMPHKDFRPLKSIMLHHGPNGSLNGICFSHDEKNFKPYINKVHDYYSFVKRGTTLSSDDTEPYETNPVEWSRPESTDPTSTNVFSRYCDGHRDPLSENEYFAYADTVFIGLELEGVKLFKMSLCTIN